MKIVHVLLLAFISTATLANTPTDMLHDKGCDTKLEQLARDYLEANSVLLSIYVEKAGGDHSFDASTLKLCSSRDLDRGSRNLRRETGFCNEQGDRLELYTFGNHWCDDEIVLGIKDLTLGSAVK